MMSVASAIVRLSAGACLSAAFAAVAHADSMVNNDAAWSFSLNQPPEEAPAEETTVAEETEITTIGGAGEFRGVSDFFNIREANPQVSAGQWELEFTGGWFTSSDGTDDDVLFPRTSLRYGITDDFFLEFQQLALNLGDGNNENGNGELGFLYFWRLWKEADWLPAFAHWSELRIPSGDGSEGVDGKFSFGLTKSICSCFRVNFNGWVMTANGGRGDDDINRRHFQWGVGPGFDWLIDDMTTATLNYLHRSSNKYGDANQHTLQLGLARVLFRDDTWTHSIKMVNDVNLDGRDEHPNYGLSLQYSIAFK